MYITKGLLILLDRDYCQPLPEQKSCVGPAQALQTILGGLDQQLYTLPAKVVILRVEQSDQRSVDRALVRQSDCAIDQNLQDLSLVGGQICL